MDVSAINPIGPRLAAAPVSTHDAAQGRQVAQAAKAVNESGMLGKDQLVLLIDSRTHRPIIRVEDRETNEVVMQIPPEYVLRLAENLKLK